MTCKCPKCGRTEAQITADAKTLGLLQEFQSGVYNCCQIVEWADEQWLAWFEATEEDSRLVDNMTGRSQIMRVKMKAYSFLSACAGNKSPGTDIPALLQMGEPRRGTGFGLNAPIRY